MTRYHTVGYSTVYEYYAYGREVNKKRPRIAQMVILKKVFSLNFSLLIFSLYCPPSNAWVLVQSSWTPSTPITKETPLLLTSLLRFFHLWSFYNLTTSFYSRTRPTIL